MSMCLHGEMVGSGPEYGIDSLILDTKHPDR